MDKKTENINCFFCLAKNKVFWIDASSLKCENCLAQFFIEEQPGKSSKKPVALQDTSIMKTDKMMGYIFAFTIEGDISKGLANDLVNIFEKEEDKGFQALNPKFESILWYYSKNAMFDQEIIEEAAKKFAYEFTAANTYESLTQMEFGHIIANKIKVGELQKMHRVINSIPKSNGNLVRYMVGEGQTRLITHAVHRAFKNYQSKGNAFGAKIARAMCA